MDGVKEFLSSRVPNAADARRAIGDTIDPITFKGNDFT